MIHTYKKYIGIAGLKIFSSKKWCTIKIFFKGAGVVTLSLPPSPYEQFLPLPTPYFKICLERFFNDPPTPPHYPTSSLFYCHQKPITRSLELHYSGQFSGCAGCQLSNQPLLWSHIRIGEVPFRFYVRRWREAFHWAFHSVNLSIHRTLHSINLSKDSKKCFFISNQIGSNATK